MQHQRAVLRWPFRIGRAELWFCNFGGVPPGFLFALRRLNFVAIFSIGLWLAGMSVLLGGGGPCEGES